MALKSTLVLVSVLSVSGCMDSMHGEREGKADQASYSSEGERLYFTGVSSSGDRMVAEGGHHHMQMHGGSCVTCHGADKQGGAIMWPRFWIVAPPLTAHALLNEHNDGHAHAAYDETALKNAIVLGINPDGKKLHDTMPKWNMSEQSLDALVRYLMIDKH